MLNQLKKTKGAGFTIIEVMIVLAIAGLIILVVLLAVPAVQRNARNTAIKNDASAIAGGVSEFASNNDGLIPQAAASSQAGSSVTLQRTAAVTATDAKVQGSTTVTFATGAVSAYDPAPGTLHVVFGGKCPTTVSGNTVSTTVSGRSTAIIYAIESSAGEPARCLDS